MGLAWLRSTPLTSIFRGFFRAHSMHVVTPGRASSLSGEIGLPHRAQGLCTIGGFFDMALPYRDGVFARTVDLLPFPTAIKSRIKPCMRLKGKSIIITGSTTGIGEAIARRCVAEGAQVLVHGLEKELGEKVVSDLGGSAKLHIDDLNDPDAAPRLTAAALQAFGKINAIVNNAAWIVRSNLLTTDASIFDRAMGINVRAPLLLVRAGLSSLKQTEGCVLNIGSINAYCGEANQLAYSISKGALMTLTCNLADAHGRDRVRFNQMNLGWVLSKNEYELKIREGSPTDWPDHIPPAFAPSGKIMQPETIASAAIYWLSDESRPVSGSVVDVEQYPFIGRNPVK